MTDDTAAMADDSGRDSIHLENEALRLEKKPATTAGDGHQSQAKNLSEILLCQVCKNQFKDPRFLPCHHYFCRSCIESLIASSDGNAFLCPQCRCETSLPGNETTTLPVAYVVERIRRRIRSRSKAFTGERVCQEHSIPLKLYCMECGHLVCPECALNKHADHSYDYVTSVAPMYMESVKQQFDTLIKIKDASEAHVRKIERSRRDLLELSADITSNVIQRFDEMVRLLEERKKNILGELANTVQHQVEVYQKEEALLVSTISRIEELMYKWDRVRDPSTEGEGTAILLSELVPQLKRKAGEMTPPSVDSLETTEILPDIDYFGEMKKLCEAVKVQFVRRSIASTEPARIPETAELGKRLSLTVPSLGKCESEDVNASARVVSDNSCTPLSVSRDMKITFTPAVRGRHELTVKVNGAHVEGSPFTLFVTVPIEQLQNPVRVIRNLKSPYAVAFNSRGEMIMAHASPHSRLSVCDKQGRIALEVKLKTMHNPSGVAADDQDNIYLSDSKSHCVMKFGADGTLLKTIGKCGKAQGEFSSPRGLKMIEGQLYVCDTDNGRVQVFNKQLEFVSAFKVGRGMTDITCSQDGRFYVSGKDVKVLDRDHAYLFSIYDMNSVSLCFNWRQNTLCLADCRRNCLCVMNLETDQVVNRFFTAEGSICVGRNEYGMAIDEDGYIYVCDTTNDRILVF